jgi:hypothetical protein
MLKKNIKQFFALLPLIYLTSCSYSNRIVELGGSTAKAGKDLTNTVVSIYNEIDDLGKKDKQEQDRISLLVLPKGSKIVNLPDAKPQLFTNALKERLKAYNALAKVYEQFNLLADKNYSDRTKDAVDALNAAVADIRQIPSLPASITNMLPTVAADITKSIQAKKIKMHNVNILPITKAFYELWKADATVWKDAVNSYTQSQYQSIGSLSPDVFDAAKISSAMGNEPFTDTNLLIALYKIKIRNELIDIQMDFNKKIDAVTSSFEELINCHIELAKDKPNFSDLISALNDINDTIKKIKNK